jgi:hypothetical protein
MALKKSVFGASLLGQLFCKVDEGIGLFLGESHEVTPPNLGHVVDKAFEGQTDSGPMCVPCTGIVRPPDEIVLVTCSTRRLCAGRRRARYH